MKENKEIKKNNKKKNLTIVICALLACICAVVACLTLTKTSTSVNNNSDGEQVEANSTIDWSKYKTYEIKLDNDEVVIDKAGVYNISETSTKQIRINTEDNVKLVLTDVKIETNGTPGINVESAKNVYIELKGSNEITANTTDELDAAIYSKDDLFLLGDGSLTINSNKDGIASKDDLVIESGTYNITSTGDAIKGKDSVTIADGKFTIVTEDDGIKASNSEDAKKGWIIINGGEFNITAKSNDGIQAITTLTINNGTFKITASEGLEATYVIINDGTIDISASDDGINASAKSTFKTPTIEINGGEITISMGQGDTDAIDSNGNLIINGGKIDITAQSPFDYDNEGKLNGGEVYVNGEKVSELTTQMMGGGMPGENGRQPGQNPREIQGNTTNTPPEMPEGQGAKPGNNQRGGDKEARK